MFTSALIVVVSVVQTVPLIAITFYGVIIRVAMEKSSPRMRRSSSRAQAHDRDTGTSEDVEGVLSTIMYLPPEPTGSSGKTVTEGSSADLESFGYAGSDGIGIFSS